MKKLFISLVCIMLITPLAAWAMYKPMRVLAPDWVDGVVCVSPEICIENRSQLKKAKGLYREALHDVSNIVGVFHKNPRVTFCSTEGCYRSFGFKKSSAINIGTSGIVISPRGWTVPYLRHEMIHHRQSEEFGVLTSLFKPEWLIEGMAYSLSADPRKQLSERWQTAREKFDAWLKFVGRDNLWIEARKI
ncbi:MAG TPA: hypothetical protein EYP39_02510 [Ghiorsea sp.]|nr:hypothetical protein [Ghiorsea sp.]